MRVIKGGAGTAVATVFLVMMAATGLSRFEPTPMWAITELVLVIPLALIVGSYLLGRDR